ncbi:MAG TPA: hypothetical protein VJC18_03855, partial [bacterium]|nr:hypothetical protein [bacterium]
RDGKTHQIESLMQMGKAFGNMLLNGSLQELVKKGLVDATDAYYKSVDKEDMLKKLQEIGVKLDTSKLTN